MDRHLLYEMLNDLGTSDYESYLRTKELLNCQTAFDKLCNQDELQFQIVHQIEELFLKLMNYTLIDLLEYMEQKNTLRVLTLFRRVHLIQKNIITLIDLLETMSPKEYQAIRLHLGSGSGITSPGYRHLFKLFPLVWEKFSKYYLEQQSLSVEKIYETEYKHDDAYCIAEAMLEMDALYHRFFKRHMELIGRTIGFESKSLRGRPVETLNAHANMQLYPELWSIRSQMTDKWGKEYGTVRPSITSG